MDFDVRTRDKSHTQLLVPKDDLDQPVTTTIWSDRRNFRIIDAIDREGKPMGQVSTFAPFLLLLLKLQSWVDNGAKGTGKFEKHALTSAYCSTTPRSGRSTTTTL